MGPNAMILVFRILSFKPTFSLPSFSSRGSLILPCFLPRVVVSAYLRLLIFFFPGNLDSSLCFIQPSRCFFPEFLCFFYDPMAVGNLISGSSAFNPDWTSGSFQVTYCWSLAGRIRSITLLACEMSAIVEWFEHFLALPFFGIGMKTDLFQSCGHCWKNFPNLLAYWTQHFNNSAL